MRDPETNFSPDTTHGECKHDTLVPSERRPLCPQAPLCPQTGSQGLSWLWHSAPWKGFRLAEARRAWSKVDQQPVGGPTTSLESRPGPDTEAAAQGSCQPQSSQSTTGPPPQPLPRARAQQRGAPWDRRRGWHRRGPCCFPKALGHTQQYVRAWNGIPPGRRWVALFPQRSTLGKSRMLTLKLKSRTWKPHHYADIFSSLESRRTP